MQNDAALSALSRDELEQLVSIYAKTCSKITLFDFDDALSRKCRIIFGSNDNSVHVRRKNGDCRP